MAGLITGIAILAVLFAALSLVRRFLIICRPNEVLVVEGRSTTLPDGSSRDYTVVDAGRVFRIPVIENVRSMDLSTMTVDMSIQNAFSRGNIPLSVHAIANVKVCRRPGVIDNALERFLGRSQADIQQVAKETIEGAVRGVLARLTPEQVNEERATFVHVLANDVEDDLNQLGLTIDTLNIQSVTDSVGYLDNIGRKRIANVVMEAEVAEFDRQRESKEEAAKAQATGRVAKETATANIRRAENNLRRERAELNGTALREEEQTARAPVEARARAEVALQEILARVAHLRLQADEVLPAEAQQVADRLDAEGRAAATRAQGEANAESLRLVAEAWKEAGDNAEDIMILVQLDALISQVAERIGEVQIDKINLVDGGQGETLSRLASAYPAMVASVFDTVGATTGISLSEFLRRPSKPLGNDGGPGASSEPPPQPLQEQRNSRFSASPFQEGGGISKTPTGAMQTSSPKHDDAATAGDAEPAMQPGDEGRKS